MTQIAVLSDDPRLEEMLRAAGLKVARTGLPALADFVGSPHVPSTLVVDVRGYHQLPAGLASFRRQHATTGIILVMASLEPRLMLEAMRAGVTECIHEPITPEVLEQTVRRVLTDATPEHVGQVLAFVGAKGGVGTTTVAVNTAASLAKAGGGVLLVDLHIGHGDTAVLLGADPRFSVLDALENVHKLDEAFFRSIVEKTKAGVDLLGSSERLAHALERQRLQALINFALRTYRFTVLDVPHANTALLDSLETASTIAVVTSQDICALRHAGRVAHAFRNRYGQARVKVIVNRFNDHAEIRHADVERVVGDSVKHLIPSDYRTAIEALNAGRPLALERHGRLAQSFRAIAGDLAGIVKQPQQHSTGILGKLAFRRA